MTPPTGDHRRMTSGDWVDLGVSVGLVSVLILGASVWVIGRSVSWW